MKKTKVYDDKTILNAVANALHSFMIIGLEDNQFEVIKTNSDVQKCIGDLEDAKKTMYSSSINNVIPLHKKEVEEFTDLTTLGARLREAQAQMLSKNFIAIHSGWVKLSFFPIAYNENGEISHVAFTVQQLSNIKGWIEQFTIITDIDVITGLKNYSSFSKRVVELSREILPKQLTIISVQIKQELHITEDDRTEEDVIAIRNLSLELLESAKGLMGDLYRSAANEFIYIMEISLNEKDRIIKKLDELLKDKSIGIDFAYGVASQELLNLNSIDFLVKYARFEAK